MVSQNTFFLASLMIRNFMFHRKYCHIGNRFTIWVSHHKLNKYRNQEMFWGQNYPVNEMLIQI
jgi:hypothetical protein